MAKQNFNSGLGQDGPPRQGEKGGKGGTVTKAGKSADGGTRSRDTATGPYEERDSDKRLRTPTVSHKGNPEGKGSGNR